MGEPHRGLSSLVLELGDHNGSPEGGQEEADDALHHEEDRAPGTAGPDGPCPEADGGHGLHAEQES